MLAGLAAGTVFGWAAPAWAEPLGLVSDIFLRMIRSVIAPLLAGVLVSSMARAGDLRGLGWLGLRAVIYFQVTTTAALLLGAGIVVWGQPGAGVGLAAGSGATQPVALGSLFEQAFPASIIDAMARGDVVQMLIFLLLMGAAANACGPRAEPVVRFCESLAAVAFRYTHLVMYAAPLAVFAAMSSTMARGGFKALAGLGRFVVLAYVAQSAFAVVVLGGSLLWAQAPWRKFFAAAREPFLVAFATTSSAAALPQALENLETYGVSRRVLGFVLPLSLSLNLCGSTIHLAMATYFVAQAAGIQLTWERQAAILLTLMVTCKGVAGIPRANFIILTALFASFGLPAEGLALLLGVDAVIDMIRTGVNILCHLVAPVVLDPPARATC